MRGSQANFLMVHGSIPSAPWYFSYNSVSWSISTEFFFYLMFPLLIWNWTRTAWWKWLAVLGLLILLCTFARVTSMQIRMFAIFRQLTGCFASTGSRAC